MGPIMDGVPKVRFRSGRTNVVFHGNSLVSSAYATTPMPARVQALPPIIGQVSCVNRGIPGYSWNNLIGDGPNVDSLWVDGQTNVLVLWEGTNTIKNNGYDGASCYSNAVSYTSGRLEAHPWLIVHMTTLPFRYSPLTDAEADALNNAIGAYNNLLRANWRSMGAKALVDLGQAGSPFAPPMDNSTEAFSAMNYGGSTIWTASEPGQWVHLNDNGYAAVAQMVAATLMRLRVR